MVSTTPGGIFAVTRLKVFLAVSLSFTWWAASLLPHYKPMIQAEIKSRIQEARQKIPTIKVDWSTPEDEDPASAYNASKVALLIEPRPLPHLVPQILHMLAVVPPDWRFLFIGSEKSVLSVARAYATKHQQIIGKLDLMVLPEPWEIDTKEKVYRVLTDPRFYDEFLPGVEWILKYESDSILCANAVESLNDWLDWHWAGGAMTPYDHFAGNGGLSIRRVSAIKRILGFQARYNDTEPEDEWFGKRIYILPGAKVASGKSGVLSVENVYKENAMGYHAKEAGASLPDSVWKDPAQRKKIFNYCPELSLIMDMKLDRERCAGDNQQGSIGPTREEKEKAEEERRKKLEEERQRVKAKQEAEKKAKEEAEKKAKEEAEKKAKEEAKKKAKESAATRPDEQTKPEASAKPNSEASAAASAEASQSASAPPSAESRSTPSNEGTEEGSEAAAESGDN